MIWTASSQSSPVNVTAVRRARDQRRPDVAPGALTSLTGRRQKEAAGACEVPAHETGGNAALASRPGLLGRNRPRTRGTCERRAAERQPIISPLNGSRGNNPNPIFSGLEEEGAGGSVKLTIYEGSTPGGTVVQKSSTELFFLGTWSLELLQALSDGTYTAEATQTNAASETGVSTVTFTVDTLAPTVTMSSPESPSDDTTPSFTGTASDITPVTVTIHDGATVAGTVVSTATAAGTGAGWKSSNASSCVAGLGMPRRSPSRTARSET